MFDAVKEGIFERFLPGDCDEIPSGQFLRVAAMTDQKGPVIGVKSNLIPVQQAIIRSWLAKKFEHHRDGVHNDKKQGKN